MSPHSTNRSSLSSAWRSGRRRGQWDHRIVSGGDALWDGSIFYNIRQEPLYLLRKGSRSTRLWESPPIPIERYEPRPCLCAFVARFDRRIFYYSSKRIRVGSTHAECNSGSLQDRRLQLWIPHCLSDTRRLALNNGGLLNTTCQPHTRCTLHWVRRGGRSDEGRRMVVREQGEGGEGGSKEMEWGSNDAR